MEGNDDFYYGDAHSADNYLVIQNSWTEKNKHINI